MCFLVVFIGNILLIVFDALAIAAILLNTLGILWQSRELREFYAKSLTRLLVEKGKQSHFYTLSCLIIIKGPLDTGICFSVVVQTHI